MAEGDVVLRSGRKSTRERWSIVASEPQCVYAGEAADFSWDGLRAFAAAGLVAGYLSYDLGESLEGVRRAGAGRMPSFWFGLYHRAWLKDEWTGRSFLWERGRGRRPAPEIRTRRPGGFSLAGGEPVIGRSGYLRKVHAAREAIADGHYYQANLTFHLRYRFSGDPRGLFEAFMAAQPVPFGALLDTGRGIVVSGSPERLLRVRGREALSSPMKGTAPPGLGSRALALSAKDRAENLMITDLVRHDLAAVGRPVRVPAFCRVERYATVSQMVTDVACRLGEGRDRWDALRALFPPGSVTGAPKASALEALARLEEGRRGLYTGAIGYSFGPESSVFSVAIRTAEIVGGECLYGVGSGVTWASDAGAEWEECLSKAVALRGLCV